MSGGKTGKGGRKLVPEISTTLPTVHDEVQLARCTITKWIESCDAIRNVRVFGSETQGSPKPWTQSSERLRVR